MPKKNCEGCETPILVRKGRPNKLCKDCYLLSVRKTNGYKQRPRKNHHVGGEGYRKHRPILRAEYQRTGRPCGLCNGQKGPIDFEAAQYDPWSFSVHHIRDRYEGGDRDDPANMIGTHLWCNQKAGGEAIKRRRQLAIDTTVVVAPPLPIHTDHVSDRWQDD